MRRARVLDIIRVRPFNHSGPGQSDRFVLSGFARQVAEAEARRVEPSVLVGNLDAQRDFLDVRDVVHAYLLAIEHAERGDVYNIASGVPRRVGDLLEESSGTFGDPARRAPGSSSSTTIGRSSNLR